MISFGIPVKRDFIVEGFLKDSPVLKLKVDLKVSNGLIVYFTDRKPEDDKELFSKLISPQGYSAVILIHTAGERIEYLLIRREEPK